MNFPIYLDNAATTRMAPEVLEAMMPYLTEVYGNPSSKHPFGDAARHGAAKGREQVARLLGASPAEIVFTGSATEGNHMAILGALALMPERNTVVTTEVEHPSSLKLFEELDARGYRVTRLPVAEDGTLSLADLEAAVDGDTALVTMMWANSETGVLFPVASATEVAHRHGALMHVDAVQAVGKVPVGVDQVPADMFTLSAHKIHGPKGIGALYVKKGLKLPPVIFGSQERRRRGGTENVPAIAGFGVACSLAAERLSDIGRRIRPLRDSLEAGIMAELPCVRLNGHPIIRVGTTSNLMFGHLDAEAILHRLNQAGIAVSPGSACSAAGNAPSHVLTAMGRTAAEAGASLRFSLSHDTQAADIERVIGVLPDLVRDIAGKMPSPTHEKVTA